MRCSLRATPSLPHCWPPRQRCLQRSAFPPAPAPPAAFCQKTCPSSATPAPRWATSSCETSCAPGWRAATRSATHSCSTAPTSRVRSARWAATWAQGGSAYACWGARRHEERACRCGAGLSRQAGRSRSGCQAVHMPAPSPCTPLAPPCAPQATMSGQRAGRAWSARCRGARGSTAAAPAGGSTTWLCRPRSTRKSARGSRRVQAGTAFAHSACASRTLHAYVCGHCWRWVGCMRHALQTSRLAA